MLAGTKGAIGWDNGYSSYLLLMTYPPAPTTFEDLTWLIHIVDALASIVSL